LLVKIDFFQQRVARRIGKSLSIFVAAHTDLAGADACPLSAFGSYLNGQLRIRSAFSFSAAGCFGFTRN
jgi:hypothetical protein